MRIINMLYLGIGGNILEQLGNGDIHILGEKLGNLHG